MILWLKGVVFNVTTVDLKRSVWRKLPAQKYTKTLTSFLMTSWPLSLCPPQKASRSAQPGSGDAPAFPDLQRGGQDRYQQDRGVPGGNALSSKVIRLDGFTTCSLQYQIISLTTQAVSGWIYFTSAALLKGQETFQSNKSKYVLFEDLCGLI